MTYLLPRVFGDDVNMYFQGEDSWKGAGYIITVGHSSHVAIGASIQG